MDKMNDIKHIENLLEKFYSGTSSPEEEQTLAVFFNERNSGNIPASMLADAKVFRSLHALSPTDIDVPDALEAKLEEAMENALTEKPNKSRTLPAVLRYSWIAAVACIIAGILTLIPKHTVNTVDPGTGPNTNVTMAKTTSKPAEPKVADKVETPDNGNRRKSLKADKTKSVSLSPAASDEEDGFIEITDPEEAVRIMEQIGSLLAVNVCETDHAISNVNSTFETYKEKTKNILQ